MAEQLSDAWMGQQQQLAQFTRVKLLNEPLTLTLITMTIINNLRT